MNIPNVNPTGNTGTVPAAPTPITPKIGPVLAERKAQASKKSAMTVDARLYGVKPMALSKYINDMIKVTPFSGVVYNKSMLAIVKQNAIELKQTRQGVDQISTTLLAFHTDFFDAHEENIRYLKELKELPKKPSLTSDKLNQIVNIDKENRRDALRRDRGGQTQTTPDDSTYLELKETNATLEKMLKSGEKEAKDSRKSSGGLMGFLKSPLKFIWDILGSLPGGRLLGGIAAAAGLGAILQHVLPNTLKALYHMLVPQPIQDFFKNVKTMADSFMKDPMKFIGDRIASTFGLFYDMFYNQFIAPVVYTLKSMGAHLQAFFNNPWPGQAKKREEDLARLLKDLGDKPSDRKYDVLGALQDIIVTGKVGEGRITTTKSAELSDYIPQQSPKETPIYTLPPELYNTLPGAGTTAPGVTIGATANILQTQEKVLTNFLAMSKKYSELSGGKSLTVVDAARTYQEQKDLYNKAVIAHGPESKWEGKQWAVNPDAAGHKKTDTFHSRAFDLKAEDVKELTTMIDPDTGKPLLESFGFVHPMDYEPWHIQAAKNIAASAPVISPPTDANNIQQTTSQIGQYTQDNFNFLSQYNANSLALQQQTVTGINKLVSKEPTVLQSVNTMQSAAMTN